MFYAGILLRHNVMQDFQVFDNMAPAVFRAEHALIRLAGDGLSVAQVVIPHHQEAIVCKKFHEITVTVNMLCNAMGDLDNGTHRPLRHALQPMELICSR